MSLGGRNSLEERGESVDGSALLPLGLSEMGDRYVLGERLGAGGMGEVYVAYDRQLDRKVALKFLHVRDEAVQSRVLDEARAQARIDHPYIRKVYEVGTLGGRPYIAMQLLDGETLQKVAPRFSIERRVGFILQACEALAAAHEDGLLHLDLKPANLFIEEVREQSQVWVMDFGLARRAGQAPTGEVRGTPRYMAPEQLRGQTDQFGPATDVYSLGVTLFEVVTGKTPRDMDATQSRITSTTADIPTSPETPSTTSAFVLPAAAPLDPVLRRIIERCLALVIAQRYPDAAALAEDLRRYQRGEPLASEHEAAPQKLRRLLRRRLGVVALAAAALVAALLLVWGGIALVDARRLAAAMDRYGKEANDAESLMRLGYARPVHDLSAERERVLGWQQSLVKEIDQLPAAARPPAEAALGRAYLLLGEEARARAVLEPLWQRGYRTSAVALALGTTLARLYEKERSMLDLGSLGSREARSRAAVERLTQTLRDPALAYLRQARSAGAGPELANLDLIEGEIALLEERYDEALADARTALAKNPTLFDAHVLIGRIRYQQAIEAYFKDRIRDAAEALTEARRAVGSAIEHARSYPPAYVLWCRVAYHGINLDYWGSGHIDLERAGDDLRRCRTAAEVAPQNAGALEWLARLTYKIGRAERDRGIEATPALFAAAASAEAAVAQPDTMPSAHDALSNAYGELAAAISAAGGEADRLYARALLAGKAAAEASGGNAIFLYDYALTLGEYAEYKNQRGEDPRPLLAEGIAALRRAVELDPSQVNRLALVEIYVQLAVADGAIGVPADASLQNAWAALRDAYPQPADTSLYHAITAELLHESARADFERGRDPEPALKEELEHLHRCQALSPEEPSYKVLETQALHILAERNAAYHASPLAEIAAADRLYEERPDVAVDILWPQTELQNAVTEADWALATKRPAATVAAAIRRGEKAFASALAQNPRDSEVLLYAALLELAEGRLLGSAPPVERAINKLEAALRENGKPVGTWTTLGAALRRRGELARNPVDAKRYFERAHEALDHGAQIVKDHPRLMVERVALALAEARPGAPADVEGLRAALAHALDKNRHLAWRYTALEDELARLAPGR